MNSKIEIEERRYNELREAEYWMAVWKKQAFGHQGEKILLKGIIEDCYLFLKDQAITIDEEKMKKLIEQLEELPWIDNYVLEGR